MWRGGYVLILKCDKDIEITVGKLGKIKFERGYYAYIGSGMKNLLLRVKRHFKEKRKMFWHIDYITKHMSIIGAVIIYSDVRIEDKIFYALHDNFPYIPNIGSSDTKLDSHFFYLGVNGNIKKLIEVISTKFGEKDIYWYDGLRIRSLKNLK